MKDLTLSFASQSGSKLLTINVASYKNFTPAEIEKHKVAMSMLQTVFNSVQFRDRLLALKKLKLPSTKWTHLELYYAIMSGCEKLTPEVDYEMDVSVEMYHADNRVIGKTYPSTVWTWLNRKFFAAFDYAEVGMNAFHEWLHKLGFDHASATDYNSIPYALGYLVRDMIRELMNGAVFTMIDGSNLPEVPVPTPAPKKLKCSRVWYAPWKKVCRYV